MDLKYLAEKLWYKVIYFVLVIVYLISLNNLNEELLSQNFDVAFTLLAYNNYAAIKFFIMALGLFLIGCYLIYREVRNLKIGLENFEEIIVALATIVIIVTLLLLIIVFIDNPILQAVLTAVLVVVGGVSVMVS